ncbi:hypothetical protein CFN78_20420 [Amycolatopsis antarctica]|uniref:Secreted protein n=1 Tax=Amycolatopsis antarctica TaxID=1854586 RepID=A0A263D052_9PSEU|nr:hypothetical protein [Amycolatopsis antarctica]OZM71508.1 hypothetical protein CFN78_20420 [Amycolatopsis antarctica]
MKQPKNRTAKLTLFAAPLLVVLLSGCGGESAEDPGATGGGPESPAPSKSLDEYQLDLAQCMRDQGVDMPDPSNGSVQFKGGDMTAMTKAIEVCQAELGPPPAPDGGPALSEEERYEQQLETAKCFRENGIEVADPVRGGASEMVDAPADVLEKCTAQPTTGGN